MSYIHQPIFLDELFYYANHFKRFIFFDATVGEGGHSRAFIERFDINKMICVDRNAEILSRAKKRLSYFIDSRKDFIRFYNYNFSRIDYILNDLKIENIDYALYDLGISMYHYKIANKGFSFFDDNRIDMSLDDNVVYDAFYIINKAKFNDIRKILFYFGEEKYSSRIANAIIENRKLSPIEKAKDLEKIIYKVVPRKFHSKINPATKTFQALRIAVNNEFFHIIEGLVLGLRYLNVGGRMAVISFHSLEDRLVKHLFKISSAKCFCPESQMLCSCGGKAFINVLTKTPVLPKNKDVNLNPASRSAKLRVVEKIANPIQQKTWQTIKNSFKKKISFYPSYTYRFTCN